MPKSYAPEFRHRLIELARSCRRVAELADEFEVSQDRKSTRLNSSHSAKSRMASSA